MQDLRSIGRMRVHPQQALKCPRCDSLNTKFCYYNNYNLSQPRHFCKSCRRYWTKGGVLRNVPVGGGCRKTKRSSKPKPDDRKTNRNSTSHSSSESSSLTTTTAAPPPPPPPTTTTTTPAAEVINPPFDLENFHHQPSDPSIFPDSGSFTSLMTASNPAILGFNFGDLTGNSSSLPFQFQHQQQKMVSMVEEMKMQDLTAGYMDQTVPVELPQLENRGSNGGLTAFDWQSNGDQGLFDLTGGTDHGYWNHHQWGESDPNNLYLP